MTSPLLGLLPSEERRARLSTLQTPTSLQQRQPVKLGFDRCLDAACALPPGAPPAARAATEGALNLAIRLGLAPAALLARLLAPAGGARLYEGFRRVVRLQPLSINVNPERSCQGEIPVPLAQGRLRGVPFYA